MLGHQRSERLARIAIAVGKVDGTNVDDVGVYGTDGNRPNRR